jgi:hypothetical protein
MLINPAKKRILDNSRSPFTKKKAPAMISRNVEIIDRIILNFIF